MRLLVDSSFLVGLANPRDRSHQVCAAFIQSGFYEYLVPTVTIPEATHLLNSRMGHFLMRGFVQQMQNPFWQFQQLTTDDFGRASELLTQYRDAELDIVDCVIVAQAERLNITTILTLDRRDFSIIRPKHTPFFNILPE